MIKVSYLYMNDDGKLANISVKYNEAPMPRVLTIYKKNPVGVTIA